MEVITYGGIITNLMIPDREGLLEDIVLGYDDLKSYMKNDAHFGAIIGRYANRISNGQFSLNGQNYQLPRNNGQNSLHGGDLGFDRKVWGAEPFDKGTESGLILSCNSADGEMGFPGNLKCIVTYTLTDDNTLRFDYDATTDQSTVINLTQHTYFNLTARKEDILGHELVLHADAFLPVNDSFIPTGEIMPVDDTPFDFRKPKSIGLDINHPHPQLRHGNGYDHCWVLNQTDTRMSRAATLSESKSGRKMDVFSTEPGIQLYTGNFLDGTEIGKGGEPYRFRSGLCLETQHFPDSPNQPHFPSTILNPGEKFKSSTLLKFYTE